MATAQTIINRALRLIGQYAAGETPAAEDTDDALTALNAMLDTWRLERLMVYAIQDQSLSMVAGTQSYTIGPSGNLDTTRPVKIDGAFMRQSSIDYTVRMIDEAEWFAIPDKTSQSDLVEVAFYNPTMSTGTLSVWPIPNNTNVLHLLTWTPFTAFSSAAAAVTLPPGYEQALATNLAIFIAPEYGVAAGPDIVSMATSTKAAIKRNNSRPILAYNDLPALVNRGRRSNIITDQ